METIDEKLLTLLFDKEADITELKNYILQLQTNLQAIQLAYNKLYKLHYLKKAEKVLIRKKIGYKRGG